MAQKQLDKLVLASRLAYISIYVKDLAWDMGVSDEYLKAVNLMIQVGKKLESQSKPKKTRSKKNG
jgi:hypothetical protein